MGACASRTARIGETSLSPRRYKGPPRRRTETIGGGGGGWGGPGLGSARGPGRTGGASAGPDVAGVGAGAAGEGPDWRSSFHSPPALGPPDRTSRSTHTPARPLAGEPSPGPSRPLTDRRREPLTGDPPGDDPSRLSHRHQGARGPTKVRPRLQNEGTEGSGSPLRQSTSLGQKRSEPDSFAASPALIEGRGAVDVKTERPRLAPRASGSRCAPGGHSSVFSGAETGCGRGATVSRRDRRRSTAVGVPK